MENMFDIKSIRGKEDHDVYGIWNLFIRNKISPKLISQARIDAEKNELIKTITDADISTIEEKNLYMLLLHSLTLHSNNPKTAALLTVDVYFKGVEPDTETDKYIKITYGMSKLSRDNLIAYYYPALYKYRTHPYMTLDRLITLARIDRTSSPVFDYLTYALPDIDTNEPIRWLVASLLEKDRIHFYLKHAMRGLVSMMEVLCIEPNAFIKRTNLSEQKIIHFCAAYIYNLKKEINSVKNEHERERLCYLSKESIENTIGFLDRINPAIVKTISIIESITDQEELTDSQLMSLSTIDKNTTFDSHIEFS